MQSCLCHFTQQPQSILWKLHCAIDNTVRQKTMQHQKACKMAAHIVVKGGVEGCSSKSTQKNVLLLQLPWLTAFLHGNQLHCGQLLNV